MIDAGPSHPTPGTRIAWLVTPLCMVSLGMGCDDFRPPEQPTMMSPAAPAAMDAGADAPPTPAFTMELETPGGDPRFTHAGVGVDHVFVPDPVDHAVSVIALDDGSVREVRTGVRPDFLGVAPGRDLAVVLDVASDTAHVLEVIDGAITHATVEIAVRTNAIAFTDDGQHALVYFDPEAQLARGEVPEQGIVTHIDLRAEPVATDVGVEFSPNEVGLSASPPRAYLKRNASIASIDLEAPQAVAVAIATGVQSARVTLFADVGLALSFQPGGTSLTVIDLASADRQTLFIEQLAGLGNDDDAGAGAGADPSIADAVFDTAGEHIVVALSERDLLLRLRWPEVGDDDAALTRHALAMDGAQRLLAGDGGRVAVLAGRADEAGPHTVSLWSPDDANAPLRYELPSGALDAALIAGGDGVLVQHDDGYTLVSRTAATSSYRRATGPASAWLDAGDELFVIAPEHDGDGDAQPVVDAAMPDAPPQANAGRPSVDRVALDSLEAARVYVDSPPRGLAATPDGRRVVIDQGHPAGRITILDLEGDTRRTLTGFHLTDRVTE